MRWRRRREQDLSEEIRSHLEMAARDRMDRGEDAAEAEHSARREFGNIPLIREVTREMWGWRSMSILLQDARYALRARVLRQLLTESTLPARRASTRWWLCTTSKRKPPRCVPLASRTAGSLAGKPASERAFLSEGPSPLESGLAGRTAGGTWPNKEAALVRTGRAAHMKSRPTAC